MENDSRNIIVYHIFIFHFKAFDDYVILHTLRMPLHT